MADLSLSLTALSVTALSHGPSTALSPSQTFPPIDFRSVAEPIGRIQPSISTAPGSYFFLANCKGIDANEHVVSSGVTPSVHQNLWSENKNKGESISLFLVLYLSSNAMDKFRVYIVEFCKALTRAGAEASTFGINGVKEHAMFLREVSHAQEICRKLLLNLMLSNVPGGGPTGVEFSGELLKMSMKDIRTDDDFRDGIDSVSVPLQN
ncbi:hypothetical protein Syun_031325 [Stephania yunnanensis]|uniref:Uncharacterized protein n=1 Tax=Stephania yunnanensis TaxID=152371 RepID=A0AAP0E3Q9_9MAGN